MTADEANDIAAFLHAPVDEVLKHAGVSVDLDGQPTGLLLAASINEKGEVQRLTDPKPLPQQIIDRAQAAISIHGEGNVIAAQIRALEGPLALLDDAVLLFKATDTVDMAAIGVLSICRTYAGQQIIARVEKARKTGEARAIQISGKVKEFVLQTATPVLAIIP